MTDTWAAGGADVDGRRAIRVRDHLRPWQAAGLLAAADVHVADRLVSLHGNDAALATLGAAFGVRAVRLGHVCVDLATVAATAAGADDGQPDDGDLSWPDPGAWIDAVAASPLVAVGDADPDVRPLRLVGTLLYLDRYWRQEVLVAADLTARARTAPGPVDAAVLAAGLDRLFPAIADPAIADPAIADPAIADPAIADPDRAPADTEDLARVAASTAVTGCLAVIAGGPGTGKTTVVARILALLDEQAAAAGRPPPRVALAAPTGKAAARLAESVHAEAAQLDLDPVTRERLATLPASTLHRLLGWRPDSASRFRHDRTNHLPHDVVVVDESSMLSLSLMAKLVDAVRPDARLVLVGDPEQLASVEAGAVLGDVVGPAGSAPDVGVAGDEPSVTPAATGPLAGHIVVLRRVHRFGGGIATLASAVSAGDGDAVLSMLRAGLADVRWCPPGAAELRRDVTEAATTLLAAGRGGRAEEALAALGSLRVLCAHRHGPAGVATWNDRIERWMAQAVPDFSPNGSWYAGRPLLVTSNDYELQLYNGDTGVVVDDGDRAVAVFERRRRLWTVAPSRLAHVETVHAMTVHKSQGSQFDRVVVILPEAGGPGVTRELLYTAVTRARRHVTVVGAEAVIRAAVARPVGRASGLRRRLWGD